MPARKGTMNTETTNTKALLHEAAGLFCLELGREVVDDRAIERREAYRSRLAGKGTGKEGDQGPSGTHPEGLRSGDLSEESPRFCRWVRP